MQVSPGNVLTAGGDVRIGRNGEVDVTIRSAGDHTSVQAAGTLFLDGDLDVDVDGRLKRGTELTIMEGEAIRGRFGRRVVFADGHLFLVSYRRGRVTLTVLR